MWFSSIVENIYGPWMTFKNYEMNIIETLEKKKLSCTFSIYKCCLLKIIYLGQMNLPGTHCCTSNLLQSAYVCCKISWHIQKKLHVECCPRKDRCQQDALYWDWKMYVHMKCTVYLELELELEVSKCMNIYEVNVSHAIQFCTKNVFKRI